MPLVVEAYMEEYNSWLRIAYLNPTDRPGSISNTPQNGRREVYLFDCSLDGLKSTIHRSRAGVDIANESEREIYLKKAETVKELRKGDLPYEMEVKTDVSQKPKRVRFTHV